MYRRSLVNLTKLIYQDLIKAKTDRLPMRPLSNTSNLILPTIQDLKSKETKKLGIDHGYKPVPTDRSYLTKYLPKQEDLPPRSMQDSFLEGTIPLSSNDILQEKYITFLGHVRIGRLLEDMDIFAVLVAYKHIYAPTLPDDIASPYTLVTAAVDQIDFTDFVPKPNEDIKLSGHVSWVGRSSMEVVVWLEQMQHGTWHKITRALFLIAARDATCKKAAVVNQLVPCNDYEKQMLESGVSRKNRRRKNMQEHVSKVVPTAEEQQMIHDLYMSTVKEDDLSATSTKFPGGLVAMEKCTISNVIFSHPEDRNLHNTVFGGFIMRNATELAWILGFQYSKYRPYLRSISDISFDTAIAVNSLIQMEAVVNYSHLNFYQIIVFVKVLDPVKGQASKTNTFHFTFESPDRVKQVYPKSYHEAMLYVDGKRHFDLVMSGDHGSKVGDLIEKYKSNLVSKL
ncbi:acyl-coenzyme A thioesterase 9, mitochondrial-like isoform X2 [Coccinella septempunctata]|uniref:acyl-coenzyme A thioesterase 9, mitochondrial-like isoform X2 n=1 Tax=Coccinella septempunctata TaxID=41139 RepID=UPI001D089000|nr:acyl-coenzyme A thioesterase 9, mitochondrial-like isoform X2 [Coccinella septempunctata]